MVICAAYAAAHGCIQRRMPQKPIRPSAYTTQCGIARSLAAQPWKRMPNQTSSSTATGFMNRSQGT